MAGRASQDLQAFPIVLDSALIEGEKKYSPPRDCTNGWKLNFWPGLVMLRPSIERADVTEVVLTPMMGSRPGVTSLLWNGKLKTS
jgi:hypothetical protein